MAIIVGTPSTALVATSWSGSAWVGTLSVTVLTGENLLFVGFAGQASSSVSNVSYNGTSLGAEKIIRSDGNTREVYIFDLLTPSVGTFNLTFASSQNVSYRVIAVPLGGVDETTPRGTAVSAFGFSTSATASVTTSSGDVVLDILNAQSAVTAGSGQTQIASADAFVASSYEIATSTSTSMDWSFSSGFYTLAAIPYKPAAASGPTPTPAFGRYGVRSPSR